MRSATVLALSLASVASAQISDDFESGWDQTKWPIYAPDCNQGGSVTLDTTKGHSGTSSMKVTGGSSGYCGHIFFGTTAVPSGGTVYVRTWLQAATALGSNHVTFIAMPDKGQSGASEALRIGGQNSVLMYNRQSDDATLPDMSPQGTATSVALPTGSWQCFEYLLSTNGTIETWLNGAAIAGLTVGPGISNPNSNGWGSSYKPNVQGVNFGWESYSGTPNTFWYDDIVISSSRVGCSGTTTGGSPPPPPPASSSSSAVASPPPASSGTVVTSSTTLATTTKKTTTTTTTSTTTSAVSSPTGATQTLYGQCGGIGYSGPTVCAAPASCVSSNPYYSQCLSR